jgi:hypothetical protein
LRAVIERGEADASGCHASADDPILLEYFDEEACTAQHPGARQPGQTCSNDSHALRQIIRPARMLLPVAT